MIDVKICGVKSIPILEACVRAGVRYIGLNFVHGSARFISVDDARWLACHIPTGVGSVALFKNADKSWIDDVVTRVPLDIVQLHGQETPQDIYDIKEKYNIRVIKAIDVDDNFNMDDALAYEAVADFLLFDTTGGGTGKPFDWSLLKDKEFKKPWFLAGGLHAENLSEALSVLSPNAVDIASGVEEKRGEKSAQKITDFMKKMKEFKHE